MLTYIPLHDALAGGSGTTDLRLPPELIVHIISFMEKSTMMKNLLGVSRFLSNEAERQSVYRHISISKSPSQCRRFASAIVAGPQRASYVHSFSLDLDGSDSHDEDSGGNAHGSLRDLELLTAFVNLRSLSIHMLPSKLGVLTLLTRCRFPHLTHFGSNWSLNHRSFRSFLCVHPMLKSLGLKKSYSMAFGMPTSFPGPDTLLPCLETLDGHWSNVIRLVNGRPVSKITMRSANVASFVPKQRLARILSIVGAASSAVVGSKGETGSGLRKLTIYVKDVNADVVTLIAESLPVLRSLHLVDCSADDHDGDGVGGVQRDGMERILEDEFYFRRARSVGLALSQFTMLTEFGVDWPSSGDKVTERTEVDALAETAQTLRRIIVCGRAWEWAPDGTWNPLFS